MAEEFCLVIMPFDDELKDVYYEAIKPTVEAEGLKCIRVDEIPGARSIVRLIIENIHKAKIVIADLTGQSANVFYELGVAHALGDKVIALAQDVEKDVPFNVAGYQVIEYKTGKFVYARELRDKLGEAIRTFDEWSKGPSNPVQDFLPQNARPMPFNKYSQIQEELGSANEDVKRLTAEKNAVQNERDEAVRSLAATKDELETLKQETAQLQGMKKLADAMSRFMQREMPEFGADEFDHFMEEMGRQGEVTVSVAAPDDRSSTYGKETRIKFRPIDKDKE